MKQLTEMHWMIRDAARGFAQSELGPGATERDTGGVVPASVFEGIQSLDLWGVMVDESRGGAGLDALAYALSVVELSCVDASVGALLAMHAGPGLSRLGQRASLDHVEGKSLVSAQDEGPTLGAVYATHVVHNEGVSTVSECSAFDAHGCRSAGWGDVVLGETDALSTFDLRHAMRVARCAVLVGIARAACDSAVAYAKERKQFGKAIAEFQAIQFKIADSETGHAAAELALFNVASMSDVFSATPSAATKSAAARAYLKASQAALVASDHALQVHGGYGYTLDFPVERYLRDARGLSSGRCLNEARVLISSNLHAA